jgi:hypothetical protein
MFLRRKALITRRAFHPFIQGDLMKLIRACIAAAAMAPLLANALPPGQYDVGGIQQICLTSSGTWYGTTYSAWGGGYYVSGYKTFIYGNFWSGAGNDSMVFYKNNRGLWTEWTDDMSYQNVNMNMLISFVKTDCDAPALAENAGKRPQDK